MVGGKPTHTLFTLTLTMMMDVFLCMDNLDSMQEIWCEIIDAAMCIAQSNVIMHWGAMQTSCVSGCLCASWSTTGKTSGQQALELEEWQMANQTPC